MKLAPQPQRRSVRRFALALAGLLPAAALAGCFSTNPDGPQTTNLGAPVASTPIGSALSPSDVAVGSGGNLLVLGSDWTTAGMVVDVLQRGTGVVVDSIPTNTYGMSIAALSGDIVVISDGSSNNEQIDLATGNSIALDGLGALADNTPAFVDGGSDMRGGGDVVVAIECEPSSNSDIEFYGGDGADRARTDAIPLSASLSGVYGVAYAPSKNLIFVNGSDGLLALNARTGELEYTLGGTLNGNGMAYDAATDRLIVLEYASDRSTMVANEYDLSGL